VIDRYIESRKSDGAANATVNRETALLSQSFKLAVEQQRLSSAPKIHKLSERENARSGFFEKSDFEALVKHLPKYLENFARFAYASGWRRGELRSLQWANVDTTGRVIRLRADNSKTKVGRVLALAGELWNVIAEQWKLREFRGPNKTAAFSLYVFHRKGEPIGEFRKAWASACKAAQLEGRLFHDLRRTAVRNMVRAGVPERVAMSISGHKTRAIFDRYNIVSEEDLRSAMEKTEQYLKLAPNQQTLTSFQLKRPAEK
jgi:integrase